MSSVLIALSDNGRGTATLTTDHAMSRNGQPVLILARDTDAGVYGPNDLISLAQTDHVSGARKQSRTVRAADCVVFWTYSTDFLPEDCAMIHAFCAIPPATLLDCRPIASTHPRR